MKPQHEPITERVKRQSIMRQFELQLPRFEPVLTIRERLTNYRYRVYDALLERELSASVLLTSFDFYRYRLNIRRADQPSIEMVICQKHDAVLPCRVLELDSGLVYEPGTPPELPARQRKRRTTLEMQIFVSQLVLSVDAALGELNAMPPRTRQRYLEMRKAYLKPKVGRPWAS